MSSSASQIAALLANTGPTGPIGETLVSIPPDTTGGTEASQIVVLLQAMLREQMRTNALLLQLLDGSLTDIDDDVVSEEEPEEILAPGDGAA